MPVLMRAAKQHCTLVHICLSCMLWYEVLGPAQVHACSKQPCGSSLHNNIQSVLQPSALQLLLYAELLHMRPSVLLYFYDAGQVPTSGVRRKILQQLLDVNGLPLNWEAKLGKDGRRWGYKRQSMAAMMKLCNVHGNMWPAWTCSKAWAMLG